MTDEEYLFHQEVREKKNIARSARKTNRKGKGPINMGVEYLTNEQLAAKNGPQKTYTLNRPMSYADFKELPQDIQAMYLRGLYEDYGGTDPEIAKMFNVNYETVKFLRRTLRISLDTIKRPDNEDELWCNFIRSVEPAKEEQKAEAPKTWEFMKWYKTKRLPVKDRVAYMQWIYDTFGPVPHIVLGAALETTSDCIATFAKYHKITTGVKRIGDYTKLDTLYKSAEFKKWAGIAEKSVEEEEDPGLPQYEVDMEDEAEVEEVPVTVEKEDENNMPDIPEKNDTHLNDFFAPLRKFLDDNKISNVCVNRNERFGGGYNYSLDIHWEEDE